VLIYISTHLKMQSLIECIAQVDTNWKKAFPTFENGLDSCGGKFPLRLLSWKVGAADAFRERRTFRWFCWRFGLSGKPFRPKHKITKKNLKMETITLKGFFQRFVVCTAFCGLVKFLYPTILVRSFVSVSATYKIDLKFLSKRQCHNEEKYFWKHF
jgi:hypothetical protein